jgi:Polyketide cyclase / dehydrase and lipid transport
MDLFETAPYRRVHPLDLPVPVERVWAGLAASRPMWWCRALSAVEWTSPRPFGAGTTRQATVLGVVKLYERFVQWDEGRHMRFELTGASVPLFRRFGEDYLLEPTATGCRFTWTFAYEPQTRLGNPISDAIFKSLAVDTVRHFSG